MIIFNLKTYAESTGKNAQNIVEMLENLTSEGKVAGDKFTVAPSVLDIGHLRKQFRNINIMSQNVSAKSPGSNTGWITPENLLGNEITFSLYNHSENRVLGSSFVEDIRNIQSRGIKLIVCVENLDEAALALEAEAFGIAYEPKELIGSGVSVTTKPDEVIAFLNLVKGRTMPFVGAGVSTGEDVLKCKELGAEGIILASAFVKAQDKEAKALELLNV